MHALEWVLTGESGSFVLAAEGLPPWQRLVIPTLGGVVAGAVLALAPRFLHGRAPSDYMEAISTGDGKIPFRSTFLRCVSSLVSIGSGASIGREGSMIQLSALGASGFGRLLPKLTESDLRLCVACGAAAGFAAVYNAPLAGSLFVSEVILGSLAMAQLGPILLSAAVSAITMHHLLGAAPVYTLPDFKLTSLWELSLFVLLGLAAGVAGPFFTRGLSASRAFFKGTRWPLPLSLGIGGAIAGAISIVCPEVWGNGYSVTNQILGDAWLPRSLLLILVCKLVATAAVTGSGAVGGVFTPSLFVGAALGGLLGQGFQLVFPWTSDPSHYAAVGMAAFLGATTHAPFMAIVMIFELTSEYPVVLPATLASVLASIVSRRIYPRSIYAKAG